MINQIPSFQSEVFNAIKELENPNYDELESYLVESEILELNQREKLYGATRNLRKQRKIVKDGLRFLVKTGEIIHPGTQNQNQRTTTKVSYDVQKITVFIMLLIILCFAVVSIKHLALIFGIIFIIVIIFFLLKRYGNILSPEFLKEKEILKENDVFGSIKQKVTECLEASERMDNVLNNS